MKNLALTSTAILAAAALVSMPARATPTVNYTSGINNAYTVSDSDLLQTSVVGVVPTGSFTNESTGADGTPAGYGVLTDGQIGVDHASRAGIGDGSELTYSLDTTAHTGGYDLTAINIYTSWGDSGRVDANVNVSYSLIGAPSIFIPLINASSTASGFPNPWTESNIVNLGGGDVIDHVADIRFDFPSQQNGYVGYSEIDVIGRGVAIPEPSADAALLLGLGALALYFRRTIRA